MNAEAIPFRSKPWDDPTARSALIVFSAEDAREILATRNGHNRPESSFGRKQIADQLRRGLWRVNGETIIFSVDGQLQDGQTRLGGCADSGTSLASWTVFGVQPDTFTTIDRGRKRNRGHDLALMGEKNYTSLAATLVLIALDEAGQLEMAGASFNYDPAEILARHPRIRASVLWVCARKKELLAGTRAISFCHYRFTERDPAAASRFFDDLLAGVGLDRGDPVLLLRNRLIGDRLSKSRLPIVEVLALIIKAWNYRRQGSSSVRYLGWRAEGPRKEPFPTII